jgi:hypothetical protein
VKRLATSMLASAALVLCVAGTARGAGQPIVRVTLDPMGPVLVGQQVKVKLQVLVPNFFMSGVEIPTIDIPGAIVARPDEGAEHLTETIGGQSYAGIQQSFVITPQRAGNFTLPPAKLTFKYAAVPGQSTDGAVTLPPQKFTAKLPAGMTASGATPGGPAEPVAKVTVTQSLDRGLKTLKVGDTLTRTVSAFAERTQAMMFPPPAFEAPDGVRVYTTDPVLTDETKDRVGFVGGRRTDRATYLFEKPGEYTLPAIEVAWFNVKTGRQEVARAPEIKVSVAPNPGAAPAIAPESPPEAAAASRAAPRIDWRRWAPWAIGAALTALLVVWLGRRWLPRYLTWLGDRRHAREESEPAYFARAERACRAGDPRAAYQALAIWTQRAGAKSTAAWCDASGDARVRGQVETLERLLFAANAPDARWDGHSFAAVIAAARKTWLSRRAHATSSSSALPALNP